MKRTVCNCLFVAALAALPGCLAVNAMFGVLGLVTSGPVQYAGTAYTVGEYTYEYAVNGKTPDAVLGEKFAWLTEDEPQPPVVLAETSPEGAPPHGATQADAATPLMADGADSLTLRPGHGPQPETDRYDTVSLMADAGPAAGPPAIPVSQRTRSAPARPTVATVTVAAAKPAPATHAAPVTTEAAAVEPTAPTRTATATAPPSGFNPFSGTDSLAARMDRMESTLAQAERILLREPDQGVIYPASRNDDPQGSDTAGVSGEWSIRHPVMQPGPGQPGIAVRPAVPNTAEAALATPFRAS
jgi:hypothetical protein